MCKEMSGWLFADGRIMLSLTSDSHGKIAQLGQLTDNNIGTSVVAAFEYQGAGKKVEWSRMTKGTGRYTQAIEKYEQDVLVSLNYVFAVIRGENPEVPKLLGSGITVMNWPMGQEECGSGSADASNNSTSLRIPRILDDSRADRVFSLVAGTGTGNQ